MKKPAPTVIERAFREGFAHGFKLASAVIVNAAMNAGPTDQQAESAWAACGAGLEARLEKALLDYLQHSDSSPRTLRKGQTA